MFAKVRGWFIVISAVTSILLLSCSEGPQDSQVKSSGHAVSWDEQCGDSTITIEYSGCLLPDHEDQNNRWQRRPDSVGEPYTDNCFLVMPLFEPVGGVAYSRTDELLNQGDGFSIEARLKIEEHLTGPYVSYFSGLR